MKKIVFTLTLLLIFCTALTMTVMADGNALGLYGWDVSASAETGSGGAFTVNALVGQTVADDGAHATGSGFSMQNGFLNSGQSSVPTAILASGMQVAAGNTPALLALLLLCASGLLLVTSRMTARR